ncbi:hypothetical protein NH514_12460 [Pseudoalteromonas sp. ACER1]|uniref:hypothetical protein n=1 Tax=unclassified Pseudoalteromonas TaxID=194690 RepID=UPI001F3D3881|nr:MULTISPECIES: hypothetical protein [unclassified Pseudoalteromonas]MCF2847975.1 hypothetical protein [Pseudoalteromonas sp. PAST1]MCO7211548.1 hypothetical protein [Pseudoalteromonas sp. ACER1]
MNKLITISVAVLGLSLIPMEANAKHDRDHDRYEHKHERKKHKKHHKHHHHHDRHDRYDRYDHYSYRDLPPGLYKKVGYGGGLPPGWYKRYHHGDILDRDIYRHGRVIKRRDRNGIIAIEIDDRLIHLVHDTREILSIVTRHR